MRAPAPRPPRRILIAIALATGLMSGASGQTPPAATPRVVAPDSALDSARAAFESLPEPERKAVQDALAWAGDYAGMADGSFGRQTFEAITAHQRRSKQNPNGVLDAKARADLRAAAQQARAKAGFEAVDDPRSGVRIGVPAKLLTKRDANQNGGTRWQSADDRVTLDTRSLPVPEGGLQALYDRNLAIQTPGRQVTYKVIRPDFFVIAGETATGKFYTRYAAGEAGLRGFSIGYDKGLAKDVDRLVVAIANSFAPFPLARTVEGLTIMDMKEALASADVRIAAGPLDSDTRLLVLAYRQQGSGQELVVTPAVAGQDGTLSAPLQAGARGAPAFDRAGRLRGLVQEGPDERRMVAGIAPPARYRLRSGALAAAGVVQANEARPSALVDRSAADITQSLRAGVVPVACVP
jgi:hypothetical protein